MRSPASHPYALLVVASLSMPAFGQAVPTIDDLDQQVARGQFAEANFSIHQIKDLSPELSRWLKDKAEVGIPPLQYEYSFRLLPTDPNAAVRWYARAYVARSLDFSECLDRGRNPIHMAIGTIYAPVQDIALKNRPDYAKELDGALTWESDRLIKPDSAWLCAGQQLPPDKRAQARAAHLNAIKESIDRLRASAGGGK